MSDISDTDFEKIAELAADKAVAKITDQGRRRTWRAEAANYITAAGVNARNCTTSVNIAASANTAAAGNL